MTSQTPHVSIIGVGVGLSSLQRRDVRLRGNDVLTRASKPVAWGRMSLTRCSVCLKLE